MLHEIIISNTTELLRISALDILAIQADHNYSTAILSDGSEQLISMQLGQVEELLKKQLGGKALLFVRVGRSVIINLDYIFAINLTKGQMTLRAESGKRVSFNASREALHSLKNLIENQANKQ